MIDFQKLQEELAKISSEEVVLEEDYISEFSNNGQAASLTSINSKFKFDSISQFLNNGKAPES